MRGAGCTATPTISPRCSSALEDEGSLVFEIAKGPARPRVLLACFKKSTSLHAGIGPKKSALINAKIRTAGQKEAPTESTPDRDTALERFRTTPEVRTLIFELGLSNSEVSDLFEAEAQFSKLSEHLPTDDDLEQDEQALSTERTKRLSEIHSDEVALEAQVKSGNLGKARELEDRLDEKRVELAQVSSVGPDSFEDGTLSATDRSALLAMNNIGLRQLLARISELKNEVRRVEKDDTLTPDEVRTRQGGLHRQLIKLQGQLSAYQLKWTPSDVVTDGARSGLQPLKGSRAVQVVDAGAQLQDDSAGHVELYARQSVRWLPPTSLLPDSAHRCRLVASYAARSDHPVGGLAAPQAATTLRSVRRDTTATADGGSGSCCLASAVGARLPSSGLDGSGSTRPLQSLIPDACLLWVTSRNTTESIFMAWTPGGQFVIVHLGRRHFSDWRPMGPSRWKQKQVEAYLGTKFQLHSSLEDTGNVPAPFGPTAL